MTELSFAKQFLQTLDTRPLQISSDYIADAKQLPAQAAYILPRNAKPYSKPTTSPSTTAAQQDASSNSAASPQALTITLKTIRPTPSTPTALTLSSQTPQTSIFEIKSLAARRAGFATDKVKILWEKRPVSDSKTIDEVAGAAAAQAGNVELTVMFVGSPTAVPEPEAGNEPSKAPIVNADAAALEAGRAGGEQDVVMADGGGGLGGAAAAATVSGWDICETSEFWDDLGAFVLQRVKDEEVARVLLARFRESWKDAR